jgi:hypothetical protein
MSNAATTEERLLSTMIGTLPILWNDIKKTL